jgi:response regulator RpfG family c-di-GMP phosphodiesterase
MGAHILVVDDESAVRDLLVTWLQAAGHRCTEAATAEEALERAAASPVDLALLDLALPGKDGLWLAERLRERDADMALVMVTGLRRFDAAVAGLRLGVLDYLVKPFTHAELTQVVRRAVDWRTTLVNDRRRLDERQRDMDRRSRELTGDLAALERASAGAIHALLETLTRRDPTAAAHASRVAGMAVRLGAALGLPADVLADVERGALLHDIGKLALPDTLAFKEGPLADEDIELLRSHVDIGRQIVGAVPALETVAAIVGASHEAFDGSGHPSGTAGTEIPLGARIVAIVDTFDALTFGRDLTDPLTFARAAAELVRCSGSQFDPDLVRIWLRVADPVGDDRDDAPAFEAAPPPTGTVK